MPELHATLAKEGAQLLVSCINNMPQIFANAMQQNNEDATYGLFEMELSFTCFLFGKY